VSETLIRMPKLADTLVEGTVGQWLKHVGDTVGQGEPLASIETDKVTTEITSPAAGTLLEVLVREGQAVPIETVIARIGAPEPAAPAPAPAAEPPPSAAPKPTPVAARLLAEHNLTPQQVTSRPGRLTKKDIVHFLQHPSPAPADPCAGQDAHIEDSERTGPGLPPPSGRAAVSPVGGEVLVAEPQQFGPGAPKLGTGASEQGQLVALSSMRRAIAEHMARASRTIPHGQTVMDADLTRLVAWRESTKAGFLEAEKAGLTFTVLFVHALARQLARLTGGSVDLGMAVALDAGLIVPVVRGADALSLGATAQAVSDLAARARAGKLALEETRGAQMTVTNVGSFGNLTASPIVPLGQRAILGPGLVERRPMPAPDGGIRLGWRCLLCLMFDRREFDDFSADRLLRGVVDELGRISTDAAQVS
jgi:2-oxoglutarate dehydrogenase E2 component (dihydrolipoamide succinyltransferase)